MAERQSLIDAYYPESLFRMTALRVLVGTEFELRKQPPVSGAKPVYWLVDTQWIHTGWLMPPI